jgi:hypothetical protein
MKKRFYAAIIALFFCKIMLAQHPNIVIDNSGGADEPSICIDPRNANRMVAGSNIANIYYSSDAGKTWTKKVQQSSFGVYGDPVIVCDTAGAFYHFHLSNPPTGSWIDRIVGQKSTDGGKTWTDGAFMGKDGTKNQDKHWISVDHRTNTLYCTWTQFDKYESTAPQDLDSRKTHRRARWRLPRRRRHRRRRRAVRWHQRRSFRRVGKSDGFGFQSLARRRRDLVAPRAQNCGHRRRLEVRRFGHYARQRTAFHGLRHESKRLPRNDLRQLVRPKKRRQQYRHLAHQIDRRRRNVVAPKARQRRCGQSPTVFYVHDG